MDVKHNIRTVFVRNIPFEADSAQLEQLFTDVGPVRSAFVVQRKGSNKHAGYGFVQFATPEDAAQAVQAFQSKRVNGRLLQVTQAVQRAAFEERKRKHVEGPSNDGQQVAVAAKQARRHVPAQATEERAVANKSAATASARLMCTVAVAAPDKAAVQDVLQRAASAGKVVSVMDPAPEDLVTKYKLHEDGAEGCILLIQYESVKAAATAVAAIHRTMVQGSNGRLWARQVAGEALHRKKWRLIVRNLPFRTTEAQLEEVFKKVGFPWEITLARKADGKLKGYAFIGYLTRGEAAKAIKDLNMHKLQGRPMAIDWLVSKSEYNEHFKPLVHKNTDTTASPAWDDKDDNNEAADIDVEAAVDPEVTYGADSRMQSIVDQLLAEHDDDAAGAAGAADGSMLGTADGKDKQEITKKTGKLTASELVVDTPTEGKKRKRAAAAAQDDVPDDTAVVDRTMPPAAEQPRSTHPEGATVFIRGLPLDASKEELQRKLRAFGVVKACRLVMDKDSGQPKGTAFAEFARADAGANAASASEKARSGDGPGITVCGRLVTVHLALNKDDVRSLAAQRAAEGPKDNRNLYLAKEGVIPEGSAAWQEMSTGDQGKRKRAAADKKQKLKSPHFRVSHTRLSVRNLPKSIDDKQLKALFIEAVKARAAKAKPIVRQAKVLQETDKLDGQGNAASKGIGFVEFVEHEHALCALRHLNNNPNVFGKDRRPIVEFALDNVKILRAREVKLQRKGDQNAVHSQPADEAAKQKQDVKDIVSKAEGGPVDDHQPQAMQPEQESGHDASRNEKKRRKYRRKTRGKKGDSLPEDQGAGQAVPGDVAAAASAEAGGAGDSTKAGRGFHDDAQSKRPPAKRKQQAQLHTKEAVAMHHGGIQEQVGKAHKSLAAQPAAAPYAKRPRKKEPTDNVDRLVQLYKKQLVAVDDLKAAVNGLASGWPDGGGSSKRSGKRWFEE